MNRLFQAYQHRAVYNTLEMTFISKKKLQVTVRDRSIEKLDAEENHDYWDYWFEEGQCFIQILIETETESIRIPMNIFLSTSASYTFTGSPIHVILIFISLHA